MSFCCLLAFVAIAALPMTSLAQVFHGAVLDRDSSRPVLVAAVALVDFFYKVRGVGMTDSAGRYELIAPGPGRYKIRADARGYRHAYSGEYIVQAGDTVEVDVMVSVDPNLSTVIVTGRRALAPGCVPSPSQTAETTPEICDGRWAVEISNCFDQTVNVYYSSGEGEMLFLGEVAAREYRVLHAQGSSRPLVTVRPHEDWHPTDFRDRSRGLIGVRVYCDRYWRPGDPAQQPGSGSSRVNR
jgi:hypothetical protein